MHDRSAFETRSLPALTRSYPCRFTFYVAHPARSIQYFSVYAPASASIMSPAFSLPHGGMIQLSAFQFFKTSFRYDPRATLLYGTRKNFPVYGSLTAVPGANALTST